MSQLTKSEIVYLFYGDTDAVLEPNDEWKLQAEILGIKPDDYIVEKETMEVVNIYELYNALTTSELEEVNKNLEFHKSKLYGNITLSSFMIAPDNYDFYGEPQNRSIEYYAKKFAKTKWGKDKFLEYARQFAQGDAKQPVNTENNIKNYQANEPIVINESTLEKINQADLTIHEWERTMVLKEFISLHKELNEKVPNQAYIYITDKMPKKFMYGQSIIYNHQNKRFLKDNKWIAAPV